MLALQILFPSPVKYRQLSHMRDEGEQKRGFLGQGKGCIVMFDNGIRFIVCTTGSGLLGGLIKVLSEHPFLSTLAHFCLFFGISVKVPSLL